MGKFTYLLCRESDIVFPTKIESEKLSSSPTARTLPAPKAGKLQIYQKEVHYLGYNLTEGEIFPTHGRVKTTHGFP